MLSRWTARCFVRQASTSSGSSTHTLTPVNEQDRRSISERQLRHSVRIGGVGRRCRHGFPQAFAFDMVDTYRSTGAVNSGLCRLSCPLLVRAIDEWEADAGVRAFNMQLAARADWRADFRATNTAVADMRRELLQRDGAAWDDAMADPKAPQWRRTLASGLAGITPGKDRDVKCIHALLADYFCRTGPAADEARQGPRKASLALGAMVLERLRAQGVAVDGSSSCHEQCDPTSTAEVYVPAKNKQKLWMKRQRRNEQKREKRTKDERLAAEDVEVDND